MQCHASQHQQPCKQHDPAHRAVAKGKRTHRAYERCKSKNRSGACCTKSTLRQEVKAQTQAITHRAHCQKRQSSRQTGQGFGKQQSQQGGGCRAQRGFNDNHLGRVALSHTARQGVVQTPGCGGDQHGQQTQQLRIARQALVCHQRDAARQQQQHRRRHPFVHAFTIQTPGQNDSKKRLQSQHQRRAGTAGALQTPCQCHRADDCTKTRHGEQSGQVSTS